MAKCKNLVGLLFTINLLFISGCCDKKITANNSAIPANSIQATVKDYRELDGCDFLLETQQGKKLQPSNLDPKFKIPELKLLITYQPIKDGVSICMTGEMITLIFVQEKN
jgi:hypothetical protein